MTSLGRKYDVGSLPPEQDYDVIPDGKYQSVISNSRWKTTRAGDGRYLEFELTVQEPAEYAGRKVWDRLNLENPNETAVAISEKRLGSICRAVGVSEVENAEELHDRPMMVNVRVRPETDAYRASNEVRGYSPVTRSSVISMPKKGPLYSAKNTPTPGTMPWDKNSPVLPEDEVPF